MRAGRLRYVVDVQEPVELADEHGQPVVSWVSMGKRWAGIEPVSQREFESGEEEHAHATHRIVMRQDRQTRQVRPNDRVVHESRLYDIVGVAQVRGKRADLHLRAVERVYDTP